MAGKRFTEAEKLALASHGLKDLHIRETRRKRYANPVRVTVDRAVSPDSEGEHLALNEQSVEFAGEKISILPPSTLYSYEGNINTDPLIQASQVSVCTLECHLMNAENLHENLEQEQQDQPNMANVPNAVLQTLRGKIIDPYDGVSDITDFIEKLNTVIQLDNWDANQVEFALDFLLTSVAKTWWRQLTAEQRHEGWDAIRVRLENRFKGQEERFRLETDLFRNGFDPIKESLETYFKRVCTTAGRLQKTDAETTNLFLAGLPKNMLRYCTMALRTLQAVFSAAKMYMSTEAMAQGNDSTLINTVQKIKDDSQIEELKKQQDAMKKQQESCLQVLNDLQQGVANLQVNSTFEEPSQQYPRGNTFYNTYPRRFSNQRGYGRGDQRSRSAPRSYGSYGNNYQRSQN